MPEWRCQYARWLSGQNFQDKEQQSRADLLLKNGNAGITMPVCFDEIESSIITIQGGAGRMGDNQGCLKPNQTGTCQPVNDIAGSGIGIGRVHQYDIVLLVKKRERFINAAAIYSSL